MAEGLDHLIKNVVHSHDLRGISTHVTSTITHQQFLDDNMLFVSPSLREAHAFKALLDTFSMASRTTINTDKSQIFFFHTPPSTQRIIARIIGFLQAKIPSKYLGGPLIGSALKHASWMQLIEKIESCLSSWTYRTLNIASRLILIKAVLQSMPLYLFSVLASRNGHSKTSNICNTTFYGAPYGKTTKGTSKVGNSMHAKKQGSLGLRYPQQNNTLMGVRIWWH